ncbi:MAG: ATP-binding protein [Limisphaerales bacterium]|jgi:MinD superfamily P-loop ATPase|nr:ATP-binding protein [Verrucomicrobiota bacterium]
MKQLLILSGKGGTGKTTISSAFIHLAQAQAYADCDVDAPNLHLINRKTGQPETSDFDGLDKAQINQEKCDQCGDCMEACRFGAISFENNRYEVDYLACEGCSVCIEICPQKAIDPVRSITGELMLYRGQDSIFSTAQLKTGSGNSGKLVAEVKKRMKEAAPEATPLAIIDGSPGIGCPVIASLSGIDTVLIVAEPSLSGISDLERIVKTARNFRVDCAVCINKHDLNPERTQDIKAFCEREEIPCVGKIPFDLEVNRAVNQGLCISQVPCPAQKAIETVYQNVTQLMELTS